MKEIKIGREQLPTYEAPQPWRRFARLLVDEQSVPETLCDLGDYLYPGGAGCAFHVHPTSVEVYYVLEGQLVATVEGEEHFLAAGEAIYILVGLEHRTENRIEVAYRFVAVHVRPAEDVQAMRATRKPAENQREVGPCGY